MATPAPPEPEFERQALDWAAGTEAQELGWADRLKRSWSDEDGRISIPYAAIARNVVAAIPTLLAAGTPFVADYYSGSGAPLEVLIACTLVIVLASLTQRRLSDREVYARVFRRKNAQVNKSIEYHTAMLNQLLSGYRPSGDVEDHEVEKAVRTGISLFCSLIKERFHVEDDNHLRIHVVALGGGGQDMVIVEDAQRYRRGLQERRPDTMAYFAALSADRYRAVADIERESLFSGIPNPSRVGFQCRSLLALPLRNEARDCTCGAILIESRRPLEFHKGNTNAKLADELAPFTTMMAALLAQHSRARCVPAPAQA